MMAQFLPTGPPKGGHNSAWAVPGFDQAAFDASRVGRQTAAMQEIYQRYPDDEMHPEVLAYWERRGVRKELFDADTDLGQVRREECEVHDQESCRAWQDDP
jgi:hypothetical protein